MGLNPENVFSGKQRGSVANGLEDENSSRVKLLAARQEISKLNCEIEVLQAQQAQHTETINTLKSENQKLFDLKEKWVLRLNDEMDKHASKQSELKTEIERLRVAAIEVPSDRYEQQADEIRAL